ncbi:MAG: monooxygenase [Thermoleophilia bacterium]|nr:monooxygenase [Thermoleophilia bacterium]
MVVAGAGPAGTATAIGLHAADELVRVFEARGPVATRARNIWLRPQGREILTDLGLADPGRDTTIMKIENDLRGLAKDRGVPISYQHRVLDVVERPDHVAVTVEGPRGGVQTIKARAFVDASGGRLAATNSGPLERVPTGPHHVYVTAQYDSAPRFEKIYGAFDRRLDEGMFIFPVARGKGYIAYYDLPPGRPIGDETALLARYDAVAGQLGLGTPMHPPAAFDARQHLSRSAAHGRVLKLGDSAGNADPYIGAGVTAALADSRAAVRALTQTGDPARLARQAADDVMLGHRSLGLQAGLMVHTRSLGLRALPDARFDRPLTPEMLGQSSELDLVARLLTKLPIA